jgi:hypothetical protein
LRKKALSAPRAQRRTHLSDHDVRAVVDVRGCEPQESVSSVDEQVLAAIVLNHALPMIGAVVLES